MVGATKTSSPLRGEGGARTRRVRVKESPRAGAFLVFGVYRRSLERIVEWGGVVGFRPAFAAFFFIRTRS